MVARTPETFRQAAQKPLPPAREVKAAPEAAPQAMASPLPAKPAAQAGKDVPAEKALKPKARPPQPKEKRSAAPEAAGLPGFDIIIPIPEEAQPPSQAFTPNTFQSHPADEDARVLNYQRLSHFRHRRFHSRGVNHPRLGGSSFWDPEGAVSTKTKHQSEAEAFVNTQPVEYIVKNYVRAPDDLVEQDMSSMKVICIIAMLAVVIVVLVAWVVTTVRRARRLTTLPDDYADEFGAVPNVGSRDILRAFADLGRNYTFLPTNVTVHDKSVTAEDANIAKTEVI